MKISTVYAVALTGVLGKLVEIQTSVSSGLPGINLIGLPDTALQESKYRFRQALQNSGKKIPNSKIIIGLYPANIPKLGSSYDLALAVGLFAASDNNNFATILKDIIFVGELSLNGEIKSVPGCLQAALAASKNGFTKIIVPLDNLTETSLVKIDPAAENLKVYGAKNLHQVLTWITELANNDANEHDSTASLLVEADFVEPPEVKMNYDMNDVLGQSAAKQALEIAAAGKHNVLMLGPPGVGKSMLAQRFTTILPKLTAAESIEVTAIHSLAAKLDSKQPQIIFPPFLNPHHTSTLVALIGGGSGIAKPGAITLAHKGVLFLDECTEIYPKVLEALRIPLESGEITIARKAATVTYPADFQLILSANPCACAPLKEIDCVCSPLQRRRYLAKLSGPILDRIDIKIRLQPVTTQYLHTKPAESSSVIRARVIQARERAESRWKKYGFTTNNNIPSKLLHTEFKLSDKTLKPITKYLSQGKLSARGVDRTLKLAWTIADLAQKNIPSETEVLQALTYRG